MFDYIRLVSGEPNAQGGEYDNALQTASVDGIKRLSNCSWIKERRSTYKAASMATLSKMVDSTKGYHDMSDRSQ